MQAQGNDVRYNYFFIEAIRQQEMGNLSAAFDLLNHARELNPNAPEVYFELAGYYVDIQNTKEARYCFEKAAELAPENATYLEKMGQFYISQTDYLKAIEAYERLYSSNKTREDVLQILFQLYGSQNNYKKHSMFCSAWNCFWVAMNSCRLPKCKSMSRWAIRKSTGRTHKPCAKAPIRPQLSHHVGQLVVPK